MVWLVVVGLELDHVHFGGSLSLSCSHWAGGPGVVFTWFWLWTGVCKVSWFLYFSLSLSLSLSILIRLVGQTSPDCLTGRWWPVIWSPASHSLRCCVGSAGWSTTTPLLTPLSPLLVCPLSSPPAGVLLCLGVDWRGRKYCCLVWGVRCCVWRTVAAPLSQARLCSALTRYCWGDSPLSALPPPPPGGRHWRAGQRNDRKLEDVVIRLVSSAAPSCPSHHTPSLSSLDFVCIV